MTQDAPKLTQWPEDGLEHVDACPVCNATQPRVLYEKLTDRAFFCAPGEWTLYQCGDCGAAYLDPRPNAATIGLAYSNYYTHSEAPRPEDVAAGGRKRRRIAARNGYVNARYGYRLQPATGDGRRMKAADKYGAERWIRHLQFPGAGGRLLDLGCGNGAFLVQMREAGWKVAGIDPDEKAVAAARAAGLDVKCGDLTETTFPPASFDVVTLSHVIEHVPHPVGTLSLCHRLLRPGGLIWIATPNLASLGHETFGRNWFALDPPRHLVIFTPGALKRALESAGFEVLPEPLHAWNAKSNFLASAALVAGVDPINRPRLSWGTMNRLKSQSQKANKLALKEPGRSEELLMLARKRDTRKRDEAAKP